MADMNTLKGLLGDGAEDKIKNIMSSLSGGENSKTSAPSGESLEYLLEMKNIIERLTNTHDDPRSNLLVSLKPYMKDTRKRSIDSAVKLLNLTKLSQLLK